MINSTKQKAFNTNITCSMFKKSEGKPCSSYPHHIKRDYVQIATQYPTKRVYSSSTGDSLKSPGSEIYKLCSPDVAFRLSKTVTVELANWCGRNSSLISAMVVIDAMRFCACFCVVDLTLFLGRKKFGVVVEPCRDTAREIVPYLSPEKW